MSMEKPKNRHPLLRIIFQGTILLTLCSCRHFRPSEEPPESMGIQYVRRDAGRSGDGRSWKSAFRTISEALEEAGWNGEIRVAAGSYSITGIDRSVKILGGFAGKGKKPNEQDPGKFKSILSSEEIKIDPPGPCQISGFSSKGTSFILSGANVTLKNNRIEEAGISIEGKGDFSIIGNDLSGGGDSRGVVDCRNSCRLLISGNRFHDVDTNGIYLKGEMEATISGNTISGTRHLGCAIFCEGSSPLIENNLITECRGGGILLWDPCRPILRYNRLLAGKTGWNTAIDCRNGASPLIADCLIAGDWYTGFFTLFQSRIKMLNITIAGVRSAVELERDVALEMVNCIVYGNGSGISVVGEPEILIKHSCIEGGWPGRGNIPDDPHFLNPRENDYRLSENSPCIDRGIKHPEGSETDLAGTPRPKGRRHDMGAYER